MTDGLNVAAYVDSLNQKLDAVRAYVQEMSPVFWAAIFESPEREGYKNGFGEAMREAQQDLLRILDGDS